MKALLHVAAIALCGLGWFLVLPFPFQGGWMWFGGYHIVTPYLPAGGTMLASYPNSTVLAATFAIVLYVMVAALAGYGTYLGIMKFVFHRNE